MIIDDVTKINRENFNKYGLTYSYIYNYISQIKDELKTYKINFSFNEMRRVKTNIGGLFHILMRYNYIVRDIEYDFECDVFRIYTDDYSLEQSTNFLYTDIMNPPEPENLTQAESMLQYLQRKILK